MDKRVSEASALRQFFGEQLRHLLHLAYLNRGQQAGRPDQQIDDAVEHIVAQVDPRFWGIGSYRQRLRGSAAQLITHIQKIVSELPTAILLSKDCYTDEPFINAIFAIDGINNELDRLVRTSAEIDRFAQGDKFGTDPANAELYALLFVVREEVSIFGSQIKSGVLQTDVAQTAVHFYGHQLTAPALSEIEVRSSLEQALFDSTITAIRTNLVKLRYAQSPAEQLAAALHPKENINNPEVYLGLLTEQLKMPEKVISAQNNMIRVSKMGIKLADDACDRANDLNLNEVSIGENHTRVVALVRLRYNEWF